MDEIATIVSEEVGMPKMLSTAHPGRPAAGQLRRQRTARRELPVRGAGRQLAWSCASRSASSAASRRGTTRCTRSPRRSRYARRGLHRRAEAERGRAAQRVHPRRDHRRRRPARGRVQPRDGRRSRSSARRSPRIPTSTWCRSPARPAPASASPSSRRRRSSGSRSSSAASRPTSSSTTPTSRRPSRDGVGKCYLNSGQTCTALTRMLVPAVTARRGRGASPRRRPRRSRPAIPFDGRRPASARSSRRVQRDRVRGYIQKGIDEGAKLVTGGAERARRPRQGLLREAHRVLRRHAAT